MKSARGAFAEVSNKKPLSPPWSCLYTELRIWSAFGFRMTEWRESHSSDKSSQKIFDEVLRGGTLGAYWQL